MVVCPKERGSLFAFQKKVRFEGGEREIDLWVHALLNQLSFSQFSFLFFSVFFLIFFFSSCSVFDPFYKERQEPFYSACHDHGFTVLPLNRLCLVWTYLPTTRGVCHSPLPDKGRFQFSPCYSTSFLPRYKCFPSLLSKHAPTIPPQTCLFWVVYHPSRTYLPKEVWAGAINRSFPLSPPPNHTPFTSYLWPMAPPCPIGWVQAGGAWALRVLPFQVCPRVCLLLMHLR